MFTRKTMTSLVVGVTLLAGSAPALAAANYPVKNGDTLWTISQSHHLSLSSIENANPSVDPLNLQIGETLVLPNALNSTYVAIGDDTLWTIAKAHGISVNQLEAANPSVDPMNVYPGLILKLPTAAQQAAPVQPHKLSPPATSSANSVVTASGQTVHYSNVIKGIATAYTASAASNGNWGAIDYFGNPLALGTIAVDPNVIPLGSKLYITGYNYAGLPVGGMIGRASDEGGDIKGDHIDIFVPQSDQAASTFGIQHITIYVLR